MGEAAALASAAAWAGTGVALARLAGAYPASFLSAARLLIAAPLFVALGLAAGGAGAIRDAGWWPLAAMLVSGMIGYGLGDTAYIRALRGVGLSRLAPTTSAAFVALSAGAAILLLDEPFSWAFALGGVAVIAGCWLIVVRAAAPVRGPADERRWGALPTALAIVIVAAAWTVATLLLAGARGPLDPATANAVRVPAGGLLLAAYSAAITRGRTRLPTGRDLALLVAVGVGGTGLGSWAYVYSLVEAGAARAVVLSATSPLMALPLSVVLLRERPGRASVIGAFVCFAGMLAVIVE